MFSFYNSKNINIELFIFSIMIILVLLNFFSYSKASADYSYNNINYSDASIGSTIISTDALSCSHTNGGYVDDLFKLISTSAYSNVSSITSPGYESGNSKYIYTGVNCNTVSYYVDYQDFYRSQSGYNVPGSIYINGENGYYGNIYPSSTNTTTHTFSSYGSSGSKTTYYTCGYYDQNGNCSYSYPSSSYGDPPSTLYLGTDYEGNPIYGYPSVSYDSTQYEYFYGSSAISTSYQYWSYPTITVTKNWYDYSYYGRLSKRVSYWTNEPHYVSQVYVNYIKNESPQMVSLEELSYDKYSDKSGHNVINISGKVTDRNINDVLTIKYQMDNKTGTIATVNNPGKTNVDFSGSFVVDSLILDSSNAGNNYSKKDINIWVEDLKKSSYTYANDTGVSNYKKYYHGVSGIYKDLKAYIDKIHPFLSNTTLTPSDWTTSSVQVDTDVTDFSGVGKYKEVHQVATTSKNMPVCFTTVDDLNNSGTRCYDVGNIDNVAPDYNITRTSGSGYLTNHNATVTIIRDGKSPTYTENGVTLVSDSATRNGSGVDKIYYAYTKSNTFPTSGFTELKMTGTTADYKAHRVDPPIGLTGTYYLHVGVVDKVGNKKEQTYGTTFNLDNTPPSGVNLTVSPASSTSIYVQGSAVDDYAGLHSTPYMYYINDVAKTAYVNNSRQTLTGLTPNTLYTVTFKSRDVLGTESQIYNDLARTVRTYANVPSALTLSALSDDSVGITVNPNGNPSDTEYYIERSTTSNFAAGSVTNVVNWKNLSTFNDSGLDGNKIYYYRIKARAKMVDESYVETGWSTVSNIYTLAEIPSLMFNGVTQNSLSLVIDTKSNSLNTNYEIHRSTSIDGTYSVVRSYSNATTFNNTGLASGTTYYYKVRARNSSNVVSDFSEIIYSITVPANPSISSITVPDYDKDNKSLIINWNVVSGSNNYEIYNVTDNTLVGTVDASLGKYEVKDLSPNKSYIFKLKAINDSGPSSYGPNSTATYTRADDILGAKLTSITSNTSTWLFEANTNNITAPQYKIEFREKGKTVAANNPLDMFSESLTRVGRGLKPGVEYEVWAYTRNKGNLENPAIKVSDSFFMNRPPEFSDVKLNSDKFSEVEGFNNLNVSGKLRDLDFELIPDVYNLYYTIYNEDNSVVSGFNNIFVKEYTALNNGAWDKFNIDIPINSNLKEGKYKIKLTIIDSNNEKDEVSLSFLVDKSKPVGNLVLKNSNNNAINYKLESVNGDIAGLKDKPFDVYRKVNSGKYNTLLNESSNYDFIDNDIKSNTLYSYKVNISDNVGQLYETNEIQFLTAVTLKEKDFYYDEEIPSTLKIEWNNALEKSDGVQIEIYRNGSLVFVVDSGNEYIDKELEYERDYIYEFIAVSTDNKGNRIESIKTKAVYRTGSPILIIESPKKIYKTLFSDVVKTNFRAEFKQGGNLLVNFEDLRGQLNKRFVLTPNIKNDIEVELNVKKGLVVPFKFMLENNNVQKSIDKSLLVEEVSPVVREISPEDYLLYYNNK